MAPLMLLSAPVKAIEDIIELLQESNESFEQPKFKEKKGIGSFKTI